jgi:hypothetical protein
MGQPRDATNAQGATRHPEVRYERHDVRFLAVALVIVVAIILGSAEMYAVWRLFHRSEVGLREQNVSRYPLAPDGKPGLPVAPRLEQLDRLEGNRSDQIDRRKLSPEGLLATYGPASEEGYVHIPIERAMDLVIGELRSRSDEAASGNDNGLVDSGESNSGRMFRGPRQ